MACLGILEHPSNFLISRIWPDLKTTCHNRVQLFVWRRRQGVSVLASADLKKVKAAFLPPHFTFLPFYPS